MVKLIIIIIVIVIVGLLILLGLQYLSEKQALISPTLSPAATGTPEPSYASVSGPNIIVDSPQTGNLVVSPLVIKGKARTFEYNVVYRLRDYNGLIVKEGHDTASGLEDRDYYHTFEFSIPFPKPKGAAGSLEVFDYSAKDGSQIDTVVIPIRFK